MKFLFSLRHALAVVLSLTPALCLAQGEGLNAPRQYPLQSGTLAGRPVQFYDFGPSSPDPQDAYRLPDGSLVFSSGPESPAYSAVRTVYDVRGLDTTAPEKFPHSQTQVLALVRNRAARLAWTGAPLNLPVVPAGSTLERDPEGRALRSGWFDNRPVSYFDFGPARGRPNCGTARHCPVIYVDGRPVTPGTPGAGTSLTTARSPARQIPKPQSPTASPPVVEQAATRTSPPAPVAPIAGGALIASGFARQTSIAPPRIEGAGSSDVVVDGQLDEAVWKRAALLTGFSQYLPVDGRAADDSTQVLVWYSPTAIYFGIRAFAPAGKVHATLANRDNISADDYVQILLDTFNDHRQAAVFAVNPLGVQSDGTLTEGSQRRSSNASGSSSAQSVRDTVDLSADFVYQSKGRITPEGYEVEVRIPFKTLRFQSESVQRWSINIVREVQYNGHEDTWTPATRANASFLTQSGQLEAMTGLSRGVVLDIIPELTSKVNGGPPLVPATGTWSYDAQRPQLGGNVRWGITSNLTLNATAKPDFSQVEADVQQITYDPRQGVFYPERRPFFLDGIEYLQVPNNLIYTRRVISPVAALKMAGKVSGTNIGFLSAVDDRLYSASGTENPVYNMLRIRRDLGRSSTVGFTYTDKIDGSDWNRVASADARVVFGKIYSLAAQGAAGATHDATGTRLAPLWEGQFDRNGRNIALHYIVTGIHPDFAPAAGFIARGAIVHGGFANILTLYGKPGGLLQSWAHNLTLDWNWNYDGFTQGKLPEKSWFHNSDTFTLRGGWRIGTNVFLEWYRYDPTIYTNYRIERRQGAVVDTLTYGAGTTGLPNFDLGVNIVTPQFKRFDGSLSVLTGLPDDNFYEWSGALIGIATAVANWRPTDQLRIGARYVHQQYWRRSDHSTVAVRRIPRLKVEYQLARPLFLRAVAQYDAQRQDSLRDDSRSNFPILLYNPLNGTYRRAAAAAVNNFRVDWLLSYQPVPGTVLFLGYGSSLTETDAFTFRDLRRTADAFFVKLTYLFRM